MKVLVQKSLQSNVTVEKNVVGRIDRGLVLFVGFTLGDDTNTIDYMVKKVLNLRVFDDENDYIDIEEVQISPLYEYNDIITLNSKQVLKISSYLNGLMIIPYRIPQLMHAW